MKTWEIWAEGYRATGDSGTAVLLGEIEAPTFVSAVTQLSKIRKHKPYVDLVHMTYWGCRLFDNEADARKRFG